MKDFLHHFFLPHHANDHRPHAFHHKTLSIFIVIFLGLAFLLPPIRHSYPSVLGITFDITTKELFDLTNRERAKEGLKPLVLNEELSNAAAEKVKYMFEKNFWAHVAPDGTTPWYFIKNSGYEYQYAGENLARGFSSASDVIDAWMESPTHRENMLSPNYDDVGFAVALGTLTGSETVIVVEELGSKYVPDEDLSVKNQKAKHTFSKIKDENSKNDGAVAAVSNQPLIDSRSTTRNFGLTILSLFILILLIDLIVIERKKIRRNVSHNLDHIIFLSVLLLAAIIIGVGSVL